MDFGITILIIFSAALIISFLKGNSKDRCLKEFRKDFIIISFADGTAVWGTQSLAATGIFLAYSQPYKNENHVETGFFLYKTEYPTVQGIFRPVEYMSESRIKSRNTKVNVIGKKPIVWFFDKVRMFFSSVRDAIVQSMMMFTAKMIPQTSVFSKNQKYLNDVNSSVVDYIGFSYDPLLEKNIGSKVVYELKKDGAWKEYTGILVKYTKDFLLFYSTQTEIALTVKIHGLRSSVSNLMVEITRNITELKFRNLRKRPIKIQNGITINPGETSIIEVENSEVIKISLILIEEVDAVFPQNICSVRHTTN